MILNLTIVFGMGTGVSPKRIATRKCFPLPFDGPNADPISRAVLLR